MSLKQTIAPTVEPVTLQEAKDFARIDIGEDDDLVASLIVTARDLAETYCKRALVTSTWALKLDGFPSSWIYNPYSVSSLGIRYSWESAIIQRQYFDLKRNAIVLPIPPVQSISSIQYVDTSGATQTLSSANYILDSNSEPARITPAYGLSWPDTRVQVGAVTVTFVAGYGLAIAVPAAAKTFIKMKVRQLYDGDGDENDDLMKAILDPICWGSYS